MTAPGRTYRRGEPGYEEARRAALWNARVPDRFPDAIVQASDVHDVVAAVRRARTDGHAIGVRSGGHSWAGNHVRDGGVLLDVSRLDDVRIDAAARRATVGPGRKGHELAAMLAREKLFFPSGHCPGVAVGGFLLQGGFGWHSRALGLACTSVVAIDCVTADGDVVHASPDEHADLYWAARGAGPGFFAVVTRFHLRVYPRPRVIGFAAQTFPVSMIEEVYRWTHAIGPEVPATVELQLLLSREAPGVRGKGIEVVAPVFADDLRTAWRDTAFLRGSPLRKRAAISIPFAPTGLGFLYRGVRRHYPDHHRWAVDNMWTRAPIDALLPGLVRIADTLPPPPSHMLWLNWAPPRALPDMAFSMEDDVYLALYAASKDPADDAQCEAWATGHMRALEPLASGVQLSDENLGRRPARFCGDRQLARLDEVRATRDPHGRFHPWMGRHDRAAGGPR